MPTLLNLYVMFSTITAIVSILASIAGGVISGISSSRKKDASSSNGFANTDNLDKAQIGVETLSMLTSMLGNAKSITGRKGIPSTTTNIGGR